MTKSERMSRLIKGQIEIMLAELSLIEAAGEPELADDEIQEILYQCGPLMAIARRFEQDQPIEPISEIEMDKIRGQIQNWYFDMVKIWGGPVID